MKTYNPKFIKYVINGLLKDTLIFNNDIGGVGFSRPKGISYRDGKSRIYGDKITDKYGIPDDMVFIGMIEKEYDDILDQISWDVGGFIPFPKDTENVYDFIQRTNKPLKESLDKREKYYQYIINDLVKNTIIHESGIQFPYFGDSVYHFYGLRDEKRKLKYLYDFGEYVYNKYGVYEDEWKPLYLRYLEAIL